MLSAKALIRQLSQASARRNATPAANTPHIPCTPPPGGVDEEQMYSRGLDVAYGVMLTVGRVKS